ncbi:SecDF P1 head subdomain-containing protein [Fluviicola chungangensis]|uniref:SecDF P1 head subdomain domain-containing protein n=1 Tax=Fluviicola chungangensis TaxID=2597671 RepID=A0A556N2F8_9FLAO|nr:hypothetical protein [Fluviicola chungangensis]TSJ46380.1 hypothetical protein FO442_04275 [Fluviicola chungangensis]
MKCIPLLLLSIIFSCGSGSKPLNLKNAKPGNLQFFETYNIQEIYPYWQAACNPMHGNDTTVSKGKESMLKIDPRGLRGLVHASEFMIGYVYEEDLSKVDAMLAIPEIKNLFPKDLRFMWSFKAESVDNGSGAKTYSLYAIKIPDGGKAKIDGRHIETVETAIADYNGMPVIRISMNDQGSHDWEIMTRKNIGRPIAITIDDHVLSCPVVNDAITGGETEISGNFTKKEAEELAARIHAGIK